MFNIANTLYEDQVKELIDHALIQRHGVASINEDKESILMSDHWKTELKALPLYATVSILLITNFLF